MYPEGARVKSLRMSPDPSPYDFCLPSHGYLFKEAMKSHRNPSNPRYPDQYWAEIIAFKIGRLMHLPVPPTFVALNSSTGEPGALIEWFMGYDPSIEERFIPGGDLMQRVIKGFDRAKGQEHNLWSIIALCKALDAAKQLKGNWEEYWGLCLCFDAVIGNTDRHQENWGLIVTSEDRSLRFSPYFDNGTSLGHELSTSRMAAYQRDARGLDAYINRGAHHLKWRRDGNKMKLLAGVVQYCKRFPRIVPSMLGSLNWSEAELESCLSQLTEFPIQSPLSHERAEFIYRLTLRRKRLLLDHLESL